jgi:hypothetical protein
MIMSNNLHNGLQNDGSYVTLAKDVISGNSNWG